MQGFRDREKCRDHSSKIFSKMLILASSEETEDRERGKEKDVERETALA